MPERLDDQSIRNQFDHLHDKTDDLKDRMTKVEVYQKIQYRDHEKHGDKLETHGKKISKHGELITRALAGGAVVLFILDKMGLFDKLLG